MPPLRLARERVVSSENSKAHCLSEHFTAPNLRAQSLWGEEAQTTARRIVVRYTLIWGMGKDTNVTTQPILPLSSKMALLEPHVQPKGIGGHEPWNSMHNVTME